MPQPISPQQAYDRLAALCARSERAEGDLLLKLRQWGIIGDQAKRIIEQLKQEKFLDAERFARAYVHDKWEYNGWGRLKITSMLIVKGIDADTISDALTRIDEQQYVDRLEQLLRSKLDTVKHRERRHAQAALLRFAASRGFEYQLFNPIVNRLLAKLDEH